MNDAGVPCPSAADPGRNPHRTGTVWTLRTVTAILGNPRYTGRQVWNRQRTEALIGQLRADSTVLIYDPVRRTLRTDGHDALSVTIGKEH